VGFEVDPSFRQSGAKARKRRQQRLWRRLIAGLAVVLVASGLMALLWPGGEGDVPLQEVGTEIPAVADAGDELDDFVMVQTDTGSEPAVSAAASPFIDLRRDPMILRFGSDASAEVRRVPGPDGFDIRRVGPPGSERIGVLRDTLLVTQKRLVTTLPSSREDFAYFQARRSEGMAALDSASAPALTMNDAGEGRLVSVSGDEGSWGSLISAVAENDDSEQDSVEYVETRIENTTSIVLALRESQRLSLFEDVVVVLQSDRPLADILSDSEFSDEAVVRIATAAERLLGQSGPMIAASTVALRVHRDLDGLHLLQMSLYGPDSYIGSLAQVRPGRFENAADPWIGTDLLGRSGDLIRSADIAQTDLRLLDAVYSAAIRNGLPTSEVGELIVMLAQRYDLDRFAAEGDELTVLYATEPGHMGQGLGRILYAAIESEAGDMPCYVLAKSSSDGFSCFDFNAPGGGGGGILRGGLVVPVSGTRTSGFGPRHHPILKQLRNHNGVDWAAPTGTPIQAAAGGRVAFAGVAGGYGNTVYIDHPDGSQTRYAHMSRFAPDAREGQSVQAGEVIGYVGTTGRSTGPHLHFELWVNGKPVDPLGQGGGGGTQAVEALVNRIIQVESAGRADAKNPLSTATGLGQFIESTWLRMMRSYRPDLVAEMTRSQLLALRTDPALSREMVRNLARENEAYLRARGHEITSGRLYLAHFLGPEGAHIALSSEPGQTVLAVMGGAVVNANPFLRGKTIADLRNWSDRKMRGRGSTAGAAPRVAAIPPEVKIYKEKVDALLASL